MLCCQEGMRRGQIILFTAIALLAAQAQCVAACVNQICGASAARAQSLPPCHRHEHSRDPLPSPCPNRIVWTAGLPPQISHAPVPVLAAVAMAPIHEPACSLAGLEPRAAGACFSPPGERAIASLVLRI